MPDAGLSTTSCGNSRMHPALYDIACTLPFGICLTWFIEMVLRFRYHDPAKKILTVFAGLCTVLYLCHALNFLDSSNRVVDTVWMLCSLASHPMFWLYIKSLTTPSEKLGMKDCWVLIPALAISMMSMVTDVNILEKIVAIITIILVCIFGYRRLMRHDREVSNFYSDTSGKSTKPIMELMMLLIAASIGAAALNIIGRSAFSGSLIVAVPSIVFSTLLFCIFHKGSELTYTANEIEENLPEKEEPQPITQSQEENMMSRIDALMKERNLFTMKNLRITDVSAALATNRTYVSESINECTGKSFSTYINELRIEYAKNLLKSGSETMTMSEIAERSGFANDASFYRNFRKITSMTPSEWLEGQS